MRMKAYSNMLTTHLWIWFISLYCVVAELDHDYYVYDYNSTAIDEGLNADKGATTFVTDSDFVKRETGSTWNWRRSSPNDFTPSGGYPWTRPTWDWQRSTSSDFTPSGGYPWTRPTFDWQRSTSSDFKTRDDTRMSPKPTWSWRRHTVTNDFTPTEYPWPGTTWNWWRRSTSNDFQTKDYLKSTSPTWDWSRPTRKVFTLTGYPWTWDPWYRRTTPHVCDCGENSLSCEFLYDKKKCTCLPGYAQIGEICSDCYCGENAIGCHFDPEGNKVCHCAEGYAQKNRKCTATCTKQSDCLNGGTCTRGKKRANFCECKYNFGGERCEVNELCKRLAPSCDSIGAYCRIVGSTGICECPAHKVFSPESGICEDICTIEKCLHGTCEIRRKNFKCICDAGFSGTHCDQRIIYIGGCEVPLIVTSVFLVAVSLFSVVMVCFLYRKKNLGATTILQGK